MNTFMGIFKRFIRMLIWKFSSPLLVGRRRASIYSRLTWLWHYQRWLKKHPAPIYSSRTQLWENIILALDLDRNPITFLEFGVFKGSSLLWWTKALQNPHSDFVGFDCFTGLPEDWGKSYPKGFFDLQGHIPNIPDKRVSFQVGLFKDTVEPFLAKESLDYRRTVIHFDADLYSSSLYCLICLRNLLKPNDVLLFDDFWLRHIDTEFRAFYDFTSAFELSYQVLGYSAENSQVAMIIK